MRLPWIISLVSCLNACSGGGQVAESSGEGLRQAVWAKLKEAEQSAPVRKALSPAYLEDHDLRMAPLRSKIPSSYPDPFIPAGDLGLPDFDPKLALPTVWSQAAIDLGAQFFADTTLSYSQAHGFDGSLACASCHQADHALSDAQALSLGVDGALTRRNTPGLFNVAYNSTLTWANAVFPMLEMQARIPMFGDDPVELGLKGQERPLLEKLLAKPEYAAAFRAVYGETALDYNHVTGVLAAFQRSLIRWDTRFDLWLQNRLPAGQPLNQAEKRGMEMFYGLRPLISGERLSCASCHAGVTMSDSFQYVRDGQFMAQRAFHNTGLYNLDGRGAYPPGNTGFARADELAAHPELMGQFRTPPLRFVSSTAPYMHDGSIASLEDVVAHYAAGGRSSLGEGGPNPFRDPLLKAGFQITAGETDDLIAFLRMLD